MHGFHVPADVETNMAGRSATEIKLRHRAGEGIRTLDVNLGKVALYH